MMEYPIEESEMDKGLFEFNDVDMEDEYDEEEENILANKFEKRFLTKRKRLNSMDLMTVVEESGNSKGEKTVEQLMANLSIDEAFAKAKSDDMSEKVAGIIQIRKLVSISNNNHSIVDDLIRNDILSVLVKCLELSNTELQYEAAWILTNIAAGSSEHTRILHDAFIHLGLLKLFGTECDVDVANQTLWALGNFMADNIGFCYECISMMGSSGVRARAMDIMNPLIFQMERFPDNIPFLRTVSWVMGQMCHLKDSPLFKETAWDLFPALWKLSKQEDVEICINTIWGLAYLADNGIDMIMNFDNKVVKDVVPHLNSPNLDLQAGALHFFANCASGDQELTQKIIECGVLKYMENILNHSNLEFKSEAAWMISNILAGTEKQANAVFAAGLMPIIVGMLRSDEKKIREKAIWAITNVPLCGTPQHVNILLDLDVIPPLCSLLMTNKNKYLLQSVVEAINGIQQQASNRKDEIRRKILACHGTVERLKELQSHDHDAIQIQANRIVNDLFVD